MLFVVVVRLELRVSAVRQDDPEKMEPQERLENLAEPDHREPQDPTDKRETEAREDLKEPRDKPGSQVLKSIFLSFERVLRPRLYLRFCLVFCDCFATKWILNPIRKLVSINEA